MTDPISGVTQAVFPPPTAGGPTAATPDAAASPQPSADQAPVAAEPAQATLSQLHTVAAALNQQAQDLQTSLHFKVDKITGQLVVSVIDTQNNQVLLQIPGQEALAIAQSLEPLQMQLMKQTA